MDEQRVANRSKQGGDDVNSLSLLLLWVDGWAKSVAVARLAATRLIFRFDSFDLIWIIAALSLGTLASTSSKFQILLNRHTHAAINSIIHSSIPSSIH
mmetsp:Transcript_28562/g.80500  ORF Transcript_28562/g.80500 Transcript_28562/m.80500 type:complete len:98 (-) Transcript_28562:1959-2252(-)